MMRYRPAASNDPIISASEIFRKTAREDTPARQLRHAGKATRKAPRQLYPHGDRFGLPLGRERGKARSLQPKNFTGYP
jgi:hypothetical protein